MFVTSDFTTAAQRLQPGKMFDFDMRGYLGSVRQQPLPGMDNCISRGTIGFRSPPGADIW